VVVGHFHDRRASECRPEATDLCLERLVIDRVVQFEPDLVSAPSGGPSATAFPSPPPQGLFEPRDCAGDIPYVFVGWSTVEELGITRIVEGHVWAVISRDPVDRSGEWLDSPTGERYRRFARVICFRTEYDSPTRMSSQSVPGSEEIHWEDGRITIGTEPE
jgi:hypothetical protein